MLNIPSVCLFKELVQPEMDHLFTLSIQTCVTFIHL